MSERPCWGGKLCQIWFVFPVGAIVGNIIAAYGLSLFTQGFVGFSESMDKIGADYEQVSSLGNSSSVFTWIANLLIIIYGLRERCRIRFEECCLHKAGNFNWLVKFIVKAGISCAIVLSFILNLYFALFVLGIIVNLFIAKVTCEIPDPGVGISAADTARYVLDVLPGGVSGSSSTICSVVEDMIGFDSFTDIVDFLDSDVMLVVQGSLILVISQTIMFAYWMKYSTLGNVKPWWSGSALVDDGENYL